MKKFEINAEEVKDKLVKFIREEAERAGFSRGILGLSGGVDSATVAHLSSLALGPENVRGIIMPYRTNPQESTEHAMMVVKKLGINYRTVEITAVIDGYFKEFPDASRNRRGNKMARERMSVLYDLSVECDALVIGTSNRSELLLGYGTIYGDLACAIMPLGGLYKTQVRELAKYLGIPQTITQKAPSAELWLGQTDEGEMGLRYEEVDKLFYEMIDCKKSLKKLKSSGFSEDLIKRVSERMKKTEFKHRLPLVP